MKILIVDQSMVRGFAERMCHMVNQLLPGKHEARCLVHASWFDHSTWNGPFNPKHPVYSLRESIRVDECLEWADHVHFLQATSFRSINRKDLIGRKSASWQLLAAVRDRWEVYGPIWKPEDYPHVRMAVVAQGWHRDAFWRDHPFTHLPGLFPLYDKHYDPLPIWRRGRKISFAPMAKKSVAAPKAYKETQEVLAGLPMDLIHRRPWDECMKRKSGAWIGIDEVVTCNIHFSAFEYLALGIPAISQHDQLTLDAIKEATGADRVPVINATLETLRSEVVKALGAKEDEWEAKGRACREWMQRYYDPSRGIERYVKFWEGS